MPEQKTLLIMALRSLFVGSQFVAEDEAAEVPETEARELIRNGWAVETEPEENSETPPPAGSGEQQPNGESNPSANSDDGEPPIGNGEPNV